MTKLLELLNEFDKPLGWYYEDGVLDCKLNLYEYMAYEWICSARYGFVKWLVENDKIDYKKLREERKDLCDVNTRHLRNKYINVVSLSYVKLLMLLSISDTPIEDLILYLK